MIRKQTRNGIILLGLLTVASFWLNREQQPVQEQPINGLDTRLKYALNNFHARILGENGEVQMDLTAPRLSSEANSGVSTIENPAIEMRDQSGVWNIQGETAVISANRERVNLTGEVLMTRQASASNGPLEIQTSNLEILVPQRQASSPDKVTVDDEVSHLQATGLWVDLRTEEYQLKHDVEGQYAIQ